MLIFSGFEVVSEVAVESFALVLAAVITDVDEVVAIFVLLVVGMLSVSLGLGIGLLL